ncbi:hypothetical protein NDU88_005596 [Pleurodeles waltl]|uniref:Uncharacterized protein n=1 Tax=Pleurodeles waltl TaxID=8319 RepID=A0AAV7VMG5_PLEWA|nr:hypothetical protein NDU88_005596 [Pleurodeles waltl]
MHSSLVLHVLPPFTSWAQDVLEMDSCVQTQQYCRAGPGGQTGGGSQALNQSICSERPAIPDRKGTLLTARGLSLQPCTQSSAQQVIKHPNSRNRTPLRLRGANPPSAPLHLAVCLQRGAPHWHATPVPPGPQFPAQGKALLTSAVPNTAPLTVRSTNHSRHLQVAFATVYVM